MRRDGTDGARRRVTAQLGEAVYAALGLMVREYLGADGGAEETETFGAEAVGAEVNEGFDMARYLALRGDVEEISAFRPVRETAVSRAGEAAENFTGRTAEDSQALVEDARVSAEISPEGTERGPASRAWAVRSAEGASVAAAGSPPGDGAAGALPARASLGRVVYGGADAFETAKRVSEEIERDARRYDGGFN